MISTGIQLSFPLLKNNLMWVGPSIHSGDREFGVPKNYTLRSQSQRIDENGNKFISVSGVRWFTNINYKEKIEDIVLYKKYNKSEYPKYENYNAINVNKTKEYYKTRGLLAVVWNVIYQILINVCNKYSNIVDC